MKNFLENNFFEIRKHRRLGSSLIFDTKGKNGVTIEKKENMAIARNDIEDESQDVFLKPDDQVIFIGYSQKDSAFLEVLLPHLQSIEKESGIKIWHEDNASPGDSLVDKSMAVLARTKIAILLISVDFFDTPLITNKKLHALLSREGLNIFMIIMKPCSARFLRAKIFPDLKPFNALNNPVSNMVEHEREALCDSIAGEIYFRLGL